MWEPIFISYIFYYRGFLAYDEKTYHASFLNHIRYYLCSELSKKLSFIFFLHKLQLFWKWQPPDDDNIFKRQQIVCSIMLFIRGWSKEWTAYEGQLILRDNFIVSLWKCDRPYVTDTKLKEDWRNLKKKKMFFCLYLYVNYFLELFVLENLN